MDLYNMSGSPSTRAVMMTAKAVGVEFNSIQVNTFVGEQLEPWFVKINPQHTIPTLVDNGFAIWETRAIVVYLVEKYGKDDSLYPKDPQKQALINQRLFFDMGTLYEGIAKYFFPLLRTGKPGTQENLEKLNAAFDLLNTFLDGQDYVAGNQLSVADIVILATVSTTEMVDFDLKKFPNVDRWYKNAQKVTPGWDENLKSVYFFHYRSSNVSVAMPNMDLYNFPMSPASRAIQMVAKALGLELNSKVINTMEGDQLKPEFVKINPQHTIPTLVDNGFAIWESRAIAVYLVEKYGKPDSPLYPKDPQKRALINQRLYFDMGTLYDALSKYFFPIFRTGKFGDQEALDKANAAFGFLNTFLEGQEFVAGNQLTVADIVLLATVSTVEMFAFDLSKFPNVERWLKNAPKVTPGWEQNVESLQQGKKFLEGIQAKEKEAKA
ncbi:glutathione S-transferase D7 [Drosophila simulans]|nr:glutathione S-transferase D7 [Drosophila simulans]KMZ04008.1 uncharacterized protein Dsimw501_GD18820 [Drosophila simulans]